MAELTPEEAKTLEAAVMEKLCPKSADDGGTQLLEVITQAAVKAAIATIQEYSKMKGSL